MGKHLDINVRDDNYYFIRQISKEIMIENAIRIPYSELMEYALIELRKQNNKQEIKNKFVHYRRLGKNGLNLLVENME